MHAPRAELEKILQTMEAGTSEPGSPLQPFRNRLPRASRKSIKTTLTTRWRPLTWPPLGAPPSHHDDDANPFLDDPEGTARTARPQGITSRTTARRGALPPVREVLP